MYIFLQNGNVIAYFLILIFFLMIKILLGGNHKSTISSATRIHWFNTLPAIPQYFQLKVENQGQHHSSKSLFLSESPEEAFYIC